MIDGKEGVIELEIWICDPERTAKEGQSGRLIPGCGFVMLQLSSSTIIQQCPACDNEYQFVQAENVMAVLELAEVIEEKKRLRVARPIKGVSPKP